MPSDYLLIRRENEQRYGTDIGRIGPMLLADRYDDRTHFVFELLQNAEDALARRAGWAGSRSVRFELSSMELRVTHCGQPFDGRDVRGVCGIAESTKDFTSIGRFGIGFKSVYSFTNRPEIHSADEAFAIETFVWPVAVEPTRRHPDETVIILPLADGSTEELQEIGRGLKQLGARSLLFLCQIKEIEWRLPDGDSGFYLRGDPQSLGGNARRVQLIGHERNGGSVEEDWLVFSRDVSAPGDAATGHVEVAFSLAPGQGGELGAVRSIESSPLVAFFPTVVESGLGFLVQGPYRTTPSRDNVPRHDAWNQNLVRVTSELVVDALRWMRDQELLRPTTLTCLPLNHWEIKGEMFEPVFERVRATLLTEPLLPTAAGEYTTAREGRLGRTQELRELFDATQLRAVFGAATPLHWLSGDISQDRTPELRDYLMSELGMAEVTPESIVAKLDAPFFRAQPDSWILRFYEFLAGQPALVRQGKLKDLPLIRLEDGSHVTPTRAGGRATAYLPGPNRTEFPTVRRSVCATEPATTLLKALGLTEPDPVDDVIWNILPRYPEKPGAVSAHQYASDIDRMLVAFDTDSSAQRERLTAALRQTRFVRAVTPGTKGRYWVRPTEVYISSERLRSLFERVEGVFLVDDGFDCLKGEKARALLEASGAARTLQPVPVAPSFDSAQKREMRRAAGCEDSSRTESLDDRTLRGLDALVNALPAIEPGERKSRGEALWEALGEMRERRGAGVFDGTYSWFYSYSRSTSFDAAFVKQLRNSAWVADAAGELHAPARVDFGTLGWKADPYLLAKIPFKPPAADALAREVGIEPGIIDLLLKLGVKSEAELRERLGLKDETGPRTPSVADALRQLLGGAVPPQPPPAELTKEAHGTAEGSQDAGPGHAGGPGPTGAQSQGGESGGAGPTGARSTGAQSGGAGPRGPGPGGGHTASSSGSSSSRSSSGTGSRGRPFVSYVGVHPEDEAEDPDGLDSEARMELEARAIALIISREPELRRTPEGNPGFDLVELDDDERPVRWVEVKAMTGTLDDHPVGVSRTQFEHATLRRVAFWLYVVERAADDAEARIVRIQDPAWQAQTFTFDLGWRAVAVVDDVHEAGQE